ncbi:MAG: class I SAM-dependent methyltransferase [Cyclobacteriaceae bacterium]
MNKFINVTRFFENDLYLKNQANILVRRSIVLDLLGDVKHTKILDIGCGDGSISIPFGSENSLLLLDGSKFMLNRAKELSKSLPDVNYFLGDFFDFTSDSKFDVIFCIGVVSHASNVSDLLEKIKNHLSDDGVLVVQYSKIDHFYYRNHIKNKKKHDESYGYSLNTFTAMEFTNLVEQHNYFILKQLGYSWPIRPISLLPNSIQFILINTLRKLSLFQFLNSEEVLLLRKNKS